MTDETNERLPAGNRSRHALLPGIAAASCMEPPPLDEHLPQADVVFVGSVVELANKRTATVSVSAIWSGPDLPRTVTVHGGPDEAGR